MMKKNFLTTLTLLLAFVMNTMAQQPFGGCWHPEHIIKWTPENDPDAKFNRSTVPLQARFYDDGIKANSEQSYEGKVAACLTMNPMASQTPSQGANNFIGYNHNEWQYMDMVVWWGGSAGEGILVLPSAPVIDICHLNGVRILANLFFPTAEHGGQIKWVYEMLTKEGNTYPYAAKLYEIAKYYGFDGWFINQETGGGSKSEWANFIKYFHECAEADGNNNMEIQWYDAFTSANSVSQILETSLNTSYFANYGSANTSTIASNMGALASMGYTREQSFLKLYSGIENAKGGLDGNGYSLAACFPSSTHAGSVQLFNPEEPIWKKEVGNLLGSPNAQGASAYAAMKTVFSNSAGFFVNRANDPTDTSAKGGYLWPGLASSIQERSVIQEKPFVTSFSNGLGKHRFVNGEKRGTQDWYHRGMQDILPTWRWWVEPSAGGNKSDLSFDFNWDLAYNMGTSLIVKGRLAAGADYLTRLFKTKLAIAAGDKFELVYKTAQPGNMQLKVATSDDNTAFTTFPIAETSTQNGWSVATVDLSSLAGKTVSIIALNFKSETAVSSYQVTLGQLSVLGGGYAPVANEVVNPRSQNELKEEISDIRLIWDTPANTQDIHHFNVYLERNGEKKLVGQTRNEGFYIPKFTRTAGEENLKVYVTTVTKDLKETAETSITMDYPEMGAPVVSLRASKTLVKIGEEVTLTAIANNAPTAYTWTIPENGELVSQTANTAVVKFNQEGLYDIKVNVANEVGSTDCEITAYIEVSDIKSVENVAKGKTIAGVSGFLVEESPENLIDGYEIPVSIKAKWCVGGAKSHWVIIDLEENFKLYNFKIFDCGHKENYSDNFKNFKIETSLDKENWEVVLNEKGRPENTKDDWIKPTIARYVRFTPYDEEMPITIRIWEFQAYGTAGNVSVGTLPAQQISINSTLPISIPYSLGGDEQADDFAVNVKPNIDYLSIEGQEIEGDNIKFNIVAGDLVGKVLVEVVVANGGYTKKSVFEVVIVDPDNLNLLLNKIPEVIVQGSNYDDQNKEDQTTGAIGIKGMTDGNLLTWWSSPYIAYEVATQTIKFDLGDDYLISSFLGEFKQHGYIKAPTGFKIYASSTGEESDYELLKEFTITSLTYDAPLSPVVKARYLKFIIPTLSFHGISLVELEAWGKKAETTGIDQVATEDFKIYPNPVYQGEEVKILAGTGSVIKIVSLQGAVMHTQTADEDLIEISTQGLPAGTYIVVCNHADAVKTAKLIVK